MQNQPTFMAFGKVGDMPTAWAVVEYSAADPTGAVPPTSMIILATKLRDIFTFAECNRNSEWRKCMTLDHAVIVQVHNTGTKTECQIEANRMIMERNPRPRCNIYGYNSFSLARPLRCNDGKEYESQAEAARILDLNPSHLSRHLKGDLKHVKGYIFAYKD